MAAIPCGLLSLGWHQRYDRGVSAMNDQSVEITEYAEELIAVPRAHLNLDLRQDETGLVLSYDDKMLMHFPLTREGMTAAGFVSKALGQKVPALGEGVRARVSTGVLFRAMSIASLDFKVQESFVLLDRLLEEAASQRGGRVSD